MEDIAPSLPHQLVTVPGGMPLTYQYATIFMAICVVALLTLMSLAWTRRVKMIPGRGQAVLELAVSALRDLCYATMGPKEGRAYLPLIGIFIIPAFFFQNRVDKNKGKVPSGGFALLAAISISLAN